MSSWHYTFSQTCLQVFEVQVFASKSKSSLNYLGPSLKSLGPSFKSLGPSLKSLRSKTSQVSSFWGPSQVSSLWHNHWISELLTQEQLWSDQSDFQMNHSVRFKNQFGRFIGNLLPRELNIAIVSRIGIGWRFLQFEIRRKDMFLPFHLQFSSNQQILPVFLLYHNSFSH